MKIKILAGIALIMSSCIGTDVLDDPIVDEAIIISQETVVLLIGESETVMADYTNQYGIAETVNFMWSSEDSNIATISGSGEIVGVSTGQTNISANFGSVSSAPTMITVVGDINDVAEVRISAPSSMMVIGESIQLNAAAFNIQETELTIESISWSVSDENVASITETGLLTALSNGSTEVTATVDGVQSPPISITVGAETKSATFTGANGYSSEGTATLVVNGDGDLILELSDDFDASFALGTFIYMANSANGSEVKGNGLDLGEITSGGSHTFNISDADSDATLDTYRYCIVLCKPAGITFGLADFE